MQQFPVVEKAHSKEEINETLIFERRLNAYRIGTASKMIAFKQLNVAEYMRFSAGDIKSVFPEYNQDKHFIDEINYNPAVNNYETVPLALHEYTERGDVPYGCFLIEESANYGTVLKKVEFNSDEYVSLESSFDVVKDYQNFLSQKLRYTSGVQKKRHRKGVLMYGAPGNGKSIQIVQLCKLAHKDKFRVFFIDKGVDLKDLGQFKEILERDNNVFVIEEITERESKEDLLNFVDGEMSWDNSYIIATTNHPEELDWNIVDRPSRFKVKVEFKNPTKEERTTYLRKMGVQESVLNEAVDVTDGMSLDYLKNIALDSFIEEKSIPELMKEYKETKAKIHSRFKNGKLGL